MGFPNAAMDVAANNAWIAEQTKKDPSGISKPQMMVTPQTTADEVRAAVLEDGFVVQEPFISIQCLCGFRTVSSAPSLCYA